MKIVRGALDREATTGEYFRHPRCLKKLEAANKKAHGIKYEKKQRKHSQKFTGPANPFASLRYCPICELWVEAPYRFCPNLGCSKERFSSARK